LKHDLTSDDDSLTPQSIETRYGWAVVAASFVLIAIGNASYYVSVVSLKPIATELGWPRAIPALGYSLGMVGAGIGGILMGRWSVQFGMARPVAFGVCMVALGCWLLSQVESPLAYLAIHGIVLGLLGNAAFYGPLVANTSLWFDRRRGFAVGLVAAGQGLAGGMWSPIFRHFVEEHGWRATFAGYAAFMLVVLLPVTLVLRRRAPGISSVTSAKASSTAQDVVFGHSGPVVMSALCVAIVGCCIAMAIPVVHLVAHVNDLGFPLARGAEALSLALLCAIVSRLSWGWLSDRIGGLMTVFICSCWQALTLVGFALADSLAAIFIMAALFGLGYGGIVPAYAVMMREHFPARSIPVRVGVMVLFGTIGMALGAWVAGVIFDATQSYGDAFVLGFVANVANIVIVGYFMFRRLWGRALAVS
jgi:MFS family permease